MQTEEDFFHKIIDQYLNILRKKAETYLYAGMKIGHCDNFVGTFLSAQAGIRVSAGQSARAQIPQVRYPQHPPHAVHTKSPCRPRGARGYPQRLGTRRSQFVAATCCT